MIFVPDVLCLAALRAARTFLLEAPPPWYGCQIRQRPHAGGPFYSFSLVLDLQDPTSSVGFVPAYS